ncbi:EcsC family protein [Pseudooceanicola sp.]|uniref:EcsC family protein n=1 Tax=Pseudooceanicola sp. TaxID=1914328 RepID=UPI003511D328
MDDIVIPEPVDLDTELDALAARYRAAGGISVKLLASLGGRAEELLERLPGPVRAGLDAATARALKLAMQAARQSRRVVRDRKPWVNTATTTMMGAAGEFAGLPGALVELPATTTMLLRAIQGVAAEHGFDPNEPSVEFDCIRVFGTAGPLDRDDGADLSFLSLRLTLTGGAAHKLIAVVAPRLAAVLGQKLAAQTVPVLGAFTGAGVNYLYTRYYQEIAHVHFGLRRLAVAADMTEPELIKLLAARMQRRVA